MAPTLLPWKSVLVKSGPETALALLSSDQPRPEDGSNVVAMKIGPSELRLKDRSIVVFMRVVLPMAPTLLPWKLILVNPARRLPPSLFFSDQTRPEDGCNVVAMEVGPCELRPEDCSNAVVIKYLGLRLMNWSPKTAPGLLPPWR